MSGQIETTLPLTHLDDTVKADATAYLTRTGNADLLPILGLAGEPVRSVPLPKGTVHLGKPARRPANGHFAKDGLTYCAQCTRRTRADGRCRRRACGGAR